VTFEAKYLIDLSDVLGVELYCHTCKGKITLERTAEKKMFSVCPLCSSPWLDDDTKEEKNVREFVNLLRNAEEFLKGRKFSLRLQVTPPPMSSLISSASSPK
jgi:hypothetical protein